MHTAFLMTIQACAVVFQFIVPKPEICIHARVSSAGRRGPFGNRRGGRSFQKVVKGISLTVQLAVLDSWKGTASHQDGIEQRKRSSISLWNPDQQIHVHWRQ